MAAKQGLARARYLCALAVAGVAVVAQNPGSSGGGSGGGLSPAASWTWTASAFAQAVTTAEIRGRVTDPSGGVLPGADVTATQIDTGQSRATVTGQDGFFVLPTLPVGPYRLDVRLAAFSAYAQTGITLTVGGRAQIDVVLEPGAVTEAVEVSARERMVETQDTSVSQVIDQRRIVALPLNGRQATDLIVLSGGAAIAPTSGQFITTHDYPTAVAPSVAGSQPNANNYLLDGADHRDTHSNVNLPFPFPDALQEFSVQTGGLSARNGLQAGAVVNVVTKSGTNAYKGNLFEFLRNGAFNARNFFASSTDSLKRNQFGGTLGGPIRKNKTFFFLGYQGTRERTTPSQSIAFLPTEASLRGDFSALASAACQSSGQARTLLDPVTRQPFPNNFIDPSRFSTPAVNLLKVIPVSNDPCGRQVYGIPNPNDETQIVTRVDHQWRPSHMVFGRYFVSDYSNPPLFADNILNTTRAGLDMRSQAAVLGSQWTPSSNVVNAFRVSFSRLAVTRGVAEGLPSPAGVGVNMYNLVDGYIDLSVSNHFTMGGGSNAPSLFIRNQWQIANDMDWIRGRHHVGFGMSYIGVQMNERNVQRGNGTFAFNGSITGDGLVDFLLGRPSSVIQQSLAEIALRQTYIGLYLQDAVRLSRTLNLNVGLRWDPLIPEYDAAGRGQHFSMDAFRAGTKTGVYNNAPAGLLYHGDPDIPKAYTNSSWLNFAPRIGLAWDPSGKARESIRMAYGIFFDTPESFTARDWANASPWGNQINLNAPAGGFANPYADFPGGNPFPFPLPNADSPFPQQAAYINFPLGLHHPYSQKWNASLERQLGKDWLVSATYIGEKGTHLRAATEVNPAQFLPGATLANTNTRRLLTQLDPINGRYYSNITMMDDGANTHYHGIKMAAEHRFSNHFTVLSSYTYSRCTQSSALIGNRLLGPTYQNPSDREADRGPCDADLPHNFVSSFVAELPHAAANKWLNAIVADWQVALLVQAHSGFPFDALTGVDASLSGVNLDRPNLAGDPYIKNLDTLQWLNPAAFVRNDPGTFGNLGHNHLRGPGFFNADASLNRMLRIGAHRVELRAEFFNVLNHTNFNPPVTNLQSATFGRIQSADDPRIIQFGIKYAF